jgi:Mn2+/Fe2+ NRAMP family transporter
MGFVQAIVGTPQSKVSGIAIILAIIVLFVSLIFSKDNTPVAEKVGTAFIILFICIPVVLYNLFQITCLVTGKGTYGETWWCGVYAWLITAVILLFSAFIIVIIIYLMATNKKQSNPPPIQLTQPTTATPPTTPPPTTPPTL